MKRTLLVLALAVLSSAGCRAMDPKCGQPTCGDACVDAMWFLWPTVSSWRSDDERTAARRLLLKAADGSCGRGGNMEANCPGGKAVCFDRYCGSECAARLSERPVRLLALRLAELGLQRLSASARLLDDRGCILPERTAVRPAAMQQCQHCGRTYSYCCSGPGAGLPLLPVLRLRSVGRSELQLQPGSAGGSDGVSVLHAAWSAGFLCSDNPPSIGPY